MNIAGAVGRAVLGKRRGVLPSIVGQWLFTAQSPTPVDWVVPAGVTEVCAVVIAPGGTTADLSPDGNASGAGGALAYRNAISVTPGETLQVTVGVAGFPTPTTIKRGATVLVGVDACDTYAFGGVIAGTGFRGGAGTGGIGSETPVNGGGAAGYTSAGGASTFTTANGGGGTSLLGGGAGAAAGGNGPSRNGGSYGGGAGSADNNNNGSPGPGGVRIISGPGRAYPNTNTGDL